jgi:energy-coupling factor transporter ATP-binding protein EcfA2
MVDYPVVCILGRRGSGKTLTMTMLADLYHSNKVMIFSNYDLKIPYQPITFKELASFPDYLHDCVLFIDETHIGADSYNFWEKQVKDITKFVTQIRKRQITMYYSTQVWKMVAKRLRDQTDYIWQCSKVEWDDNLFRVEMFDKWLVPPDNYLDTKIFDGRPYYDLYDTKQIIQNE